MLRFAYTGRTSEGRVSGIQLGADATSVAEALMARGITPLTIAAEVAARGALAGGTVLPWQARVQPVELMLFSRQMHTLLRSGVPILRALAGLQESAPGERMKQVLGSLRRSLEAGRDLSMSLAQQGGVFSGFYVAMVRVGEMTGRLDDVFLRLFEQLEFEESMRQQVKAALRYPMFVVGAVVAAIAVINLMVVPAFASVFQSFGAELPLATRLLIGASAFTQAFGPWLAALAVAGLLALRAWRRTSAGALAWDRWRLALPLAGTIVRKATLARFARGFALALRSGVPVEQALAAVAQTLDNRHMARKVEGMCDAVQRGDTIVRTAYASGVFTPVVLQMIAVGEETGTIDELMDEVAELYINDVRYELKTLAQQIEPILIVILGVLVLVLALGVFLPVWDLGRVAFKR